MNGILQISSLRQQENNCEQHEGCYLKKNEKSAFIKETSLTLQ